MCSMPGEFVELSAWEDKLVKMRKLGLRGLFLL